MRKIILLTDSSADLSNELLQQYDIEVLPLLVSVNQKTFRDGIDINTDELYALIQEEKTMAKTSAITPYVFEEFFRKHIELDEDIIYCGLGSSLSSTYQNALTAAALFPKDRIFIIDSENLSTGIGLIMLKASNMRKAGMNISEIVNQMMTLRSRVKTQFVVESLEFLHKGGRCSGTSRIIGAVLRIKPMILVRSGTLKVGRKIIGFMKKALDVMFKLFISDFQQVDNDFIFITDTAASKSVAYLTKKFETYAIENNVKMPPILYTHAGSVISSHCGKGSIGILYLVKTEVNENTEIIEEIE